MNYCLGLDFGSGGCKATLIGHASNIVSTAYRAYPNFYDKPLWVEQDPNDWIAAGVAVTAEVLSNGADSRPETVAAIAFSAPHHVAVLLDDDDQVIRRAIMWSDQRSSIQSKDLNSRLGDLIWEETNNEVSPTWTLSQLTWIKENEPNLYSRIRRIMLMKDYVRYIFTGVIATDYVDAGGTLFYNIHDREWSQPLIEELGLHTDQLPEIRTPTSAAGKINKYIAHRTGLKEGTPVYVGTADTAAELLGAGALENGSRVAKLATAGNNAMISSKLPDRCSKMLTYDYLTEGSYYLNQATNFAAASFRWFRETFLDSKESNLSTDELYSYVNRQISEIASGSDGLIFHPYLNGERSPHWDPQLRGSFIGITTRHTIYHFARAVMEGVSYSLRDAASAHPPLDSSSHLMLIGGGAKSDVWAQLFAEIFDTSLLVPADVDSSYGTALIAATGAGWYNSIADARANAQIYQRQFVPQRTNAAYYNETFKIYREVKRHLTEINHKLSRLHP